MKNPEEQPQFDFEGGDREQDAEKKDKDSSGSDYAEGVRAILQQGEKEVKRAEKTAADQPESASQPESERIREEAEIHELCNGSGCQECGNTGIADPKKRREYLQAKRREKRAS